MSEFLNDLNVRAFLTNMVTRDLTLTTGLLWLVIATIISMVGGAIGGMILAGKEIGYMFSATIGALFAPSGAVPAVVLGFAILYVLSNF
ncbi:MULTISPECIES: hypothetical protein [unclassified Anabaena]|uniref:hypothetical protein n=1 Tax=unclassified Anabaena TaxID=2619674 RepID=UPI002B21F2AF|nr:hypothetical protein [Anabaena sp. UHCC 0399]MEA5567230.1 hypothetical protein [Anabaena sp. UHCC 0399]